MTEAEIQAKIVELEQQRIQQIAQVAFTDGYLAALRDVLAKKTPPA